MCSVILDHELVFRERDDGVIASAASFYFEEIAIFYILSFLKREPSSGAINPAADARFHRFEHNGFVVRLSTPTNCCFISGSPAIAVADAIINSSISLFIANPWSKHRYVARGRHPGTRIYVS